MSQITTPKAAGSLPKLALLALGAVAGTFVLGAANAAGTDGDVPSIVVKYSDQNLATDSGVKELYARILRAARQVCPDASFRDLKMQQLVQECRDQAVARAIRKVDNSQLAALYAAHSKNG